MPSPTCSHLTTATQPLLSFPSSDHNHSFSSSTVSSASSSSLLQWLMGVVALQDESEEDKLKRWSSFIGIIVAISGNVLISLALNVQKYAHVRLRRERLRTKAAIRRRRKRDAWKRVLSQNGIVNGGMGAAGRASEDGGGDDFAEDLLDGAGNFIGEESGDDEDYGHADGQLSAGLRTDGILPPTANKPPSGGHKYLHSPWWWMGLVLMTIGECGNFLAYGFAPASIVSPLGVVALISNCIIAPVMLKEPFRTRDFMGVVVSIAGAVVVVLSSAPEEVKLGPDEILHAISQTAFEVYFGATCAMIIALSYLSPKYGGRFILIDLGLVGLYGGYTVLSTKGISSLLSSSLYHIFTMPVAYLFGFVLVSTAIAQIKYVNKALQRFDSTQVIPTQFVMFTLSVITGSAILYRDFEKMDQDKMTKFVIGCMFTFSGVYLITSGRPENGDDEDELGIEEGDIGLVEGDSNITAAEDGSSMAHAGRRVSIPFGGPNAPRRGRRTPTLHRKSMNSLRLERTSTRGSFGASFLGQDDDGMNETSPLLEHYEDGPDSPTEHAFIPNHFSTDRDESRSEALARHSISLIPGPFVVGNQLLAVVADQIGSVSASVSPNKDSNRWAGKRVSRKGSRSGKSLLDYKAALSAPGSTKAESTHGDAGGPPSMASSVGSTRSSLAWGEIDESVAVWRQRDEGVDYAIMEGIVEGGEMGRNTNGGKGRARSSSVKLLIDGIKGKSTTSRRRRDSVGEEETEGDKGGGENER